MNIKQFLLRFFAAIGIILTLSISLGAASGYYWLTREPAPLEMPDSVVLSLDFNQKLIERPQNFTLSIPELLDKRDETPLFYLVRAIEAAKDDPHVKGIVARIGFDPPSLTQAQELAAALEHFRASGKFTYIFAPSYGEFGPGAKNYFLASQFENIWLQPIGSVGLTSLGLEAPFAKTALENIGVKTDFMRREEYKSVMEMFTNDAFSPLVRANTQSLLSNLNDQVAQGIAKARKIETTKALQIMKDGPYTSLEAAKAGLVTKIGYEDDMHKEIEGKAGKDSAWLAPEEYLPIYSELRKDEPKATVAVIYAEGMITDAPARGPSRLAEDDAIDTEEIVTAFADAAADDEVKAILFRVNSPGGSPVASETIRHALVKAKEAKKPVFVSMGAVAGSGGYWISMDADKIIANPATLTGSIGVVAGKFVLGGLFDKLGVKWDTLSLSNNADLWSVRTPFDAKGRERMNAMLDETYKAFTTNVAAARKIPLEKIGDVAKGRVFTGEQAMKVGLVDQLGGMDVALAAIKDHLKIDQKDRVFLAPFPAPETPQTMLLRVLRNLHLNGQVLLDLTHLVRQIKTTLGPAWIDLAAPRMISARMPEALQARGF